MYKIEYNKRVLKDIQKIKHNKLESKVKLLIELIKVDPFQIPPPYERLVGNLDGYFSRRINIQHRLVYKVLEEESVVRIISVWSHYENL